MNRIILVAFCALIGASEPASAQYGLAMMCKERIPGTDQWNYYTREIHPNNAMMFYDFWIKKMGCVGNSNLYDYLESFGIKVERRKEIK